MSVGMVCFVLNDSLVKYVSETLAAPQLIFLRGLLATVGLLVVTLAMGQLPPWRVSLRHVSDRWVFIRSLMDGVASLVYLSALFHMPMANANAINMSTPLLIALLSALLLNHRVSPRHWFIIALGFVGVLLVVQPQAEGFNAWAWVALAGTLCHAFRDLAVGFIPDDVPSSLITLSTAFTATWMAGAWAVFHPWQSVSGSAWCLLAAAAALLSAGYFALVKATRIADMSVIAPFRYVGLLTAVVMGYMVWGDVPNAWAWGGMALLVGAGLLMIRQTTPQVTNAD